MLFDYDEIEVSTDPASRERRRSLFKQILVYKDIFLAFVKFFEKTVRVDTNNVYETYRSLGEQQLLQHMKDLVENIEERYKKVESTKKKEG